MKKVLEAAGLQVDEVRLKAVVSALKEIDIDEALKSATAMPVAPAAAPVQPAQPAGEEKKAEEEEEEEEEEKKELSEEELASGLGALFG